MKSWIYWDNYKEISQMDSKLLTPGPVPVPDFVMQAIQRPVIHHRTEQFYSFYLDLLKGLRYLFRTEKSVGTLMGSGTYGVEMMMGSLFRKNEKVAFISYGKFSDRWADYGQLLGLDCFDWKIDWGKSPTIKEFKNFLDKSPELDGIVLTHSETSTAAILDLEELAWEFKQKNPRGIILVDGITSVGAMPYYHDAWGIDASITASQKALLNPAGTIVFALSELAKDKLLETQSGDFSNVYNFVKMAEKGSYPFTAPVQLLYGIKAALDHIQQRELPAIWQACHQSSRIFRKGLQELGGKVFPEKASDSLTAFYVEGKNQDEIRRKLQEKYGWILSGGQGELKGKIMRVSHMGTSTAEQMVNLLKDLGELL
jgi:aspartate aminotransferase-like enzyme